MDTSYLIGSIYDSLGRFSAADLAYSAHAYLAKGLGQLAIQAANEKSVKNVGFSGGAACNQILAQLTARNHRVCWFEVLCPQICPSWRRRNLVWSSSCRWFFRGFRPICFYRPL